MSDTPVSTVNTVQATKSFTPVGELLTKSWEMVKLVWKNLLILSVILWVVTFATMILGGGAIFGSFAFSGGFESVNPGAIAASVGFGILMIVAIVVASSVFGTAMMIAVAEAGTKPAIGSLISRGLKLFTPVFFTSLIIIFLIYGGFFLFVIPGIVIAILSGYSMYEVVFTENRYGAAIKNSVKIVSQNFGELLVRVLVIFGMVIGLVVIEAILTNVVGGEESAASGVVSLAMAIVQMVFSWFALCYYYITYQEARSNTSFEKSASTVWMWIVAVLGWLLGVVLIFVASAAIAAFMSNYTDSQNDYDGIPPMMIDESGQVDTNQLLEEYGQDMSEEEKQMFRQLMEETDSAMQEDQEAAQMEVQDPI
jgi:hypothetical protein